MIFSQINGAIHLHSKPNSLLTIGQDGYLKIFDLYEKVCIKSFKICDFNLSSIAMLKQDETFAVKHYLFRSEPGIIISICLTSCMDQNQSPSQLMTTQ
jgi:hypothetical protein